ncbi:MAG: [FeFe] hydrogenase H-cluster radical SAM maturase HydG [Candidatus Cloacimonadota bacterium]|nr:MAG: [FeFe] hydrogenase H-cluster radical SAM maturase HydG [Candidatus Cloacimonadota bacterium]PIE78279.1 MAG: [FeFe] hydrogenase H-cluster radical SAM maturase HydG [Candidatus Delongbacteria bacterium]
MVMDTGFIDHKKIYEYLENKKAPSKEELNDILTKARELKGISFEEAERLLMVDNKEDLELLCQTANYIKEEIYGKRLVLFAPLYVSNLCSNECSYCAFKKSNKMIPRRTLNMEEIRRETESLISSGHKRILLVSGEGLGRNGLDYTIEAIENIYSVSKSKGNIRRINVNIAALEIEDYKRLKDAKIGTYQLFQETYNYNTYKKMHLSGPKADYRYHLGAMDRAMEAGIDDVGVGILFGLEDYRFEIMALLQHIKHLESRFGVGPHTISVPRLEPATNSDISSNPPHPVTDDDFRKIIAILRITIPYTGIILSTRENPEMRKEAINLGISQISAGSKSNPGGYSENKAAEQFSLGDHRSLHEVIEDIVDLKHIPSFCTGCYRLGRVGKDFMDLAKPGAIKNHCYPNAVFSFGEYLEGFASDTLKKKGYDLIESMMGSEIKNDVIRKMTIENLKRVRDGEKDVYV